MYEWIFMYLSLHLRHLRKNNAFGSASREERPVDSWRVGHFVIIIVIIVVVVWVCERCSASQAATTRPIAAKVINFSPLKLDSWKLYFTYNSHYYYYYYYVFVRICVSAVDTTMNRPCIYGYIYIWQDENRNELLYIFIYIIEVLYLSSHFSTQRIYLLGVGLSTTVTIELHDRLLTLARKIKNLSKSSLRRWRWKKRMCEMKEEKNLGNKLYSMLIDEKKSIPIDA